MNARTNPDDLMEEYPDVLDPPHGLDADDDHPSHLADAGEGDGHGHGHDHDGHDHDHDHDHDHEVVENEGEEHAPAKGSNGVKIAMMAFGMIILLVIVGAVSLFVLHRKHVRQAEMAAAAQVAEAPAPAQPEPPVAQAAPAGQIDAASAPAAAAVPPATTAPVTAPVAAAVATVAPQAAPVAPAAAPVAPAMAPQPQVVAPQAQAAPTVSVAQIQGVADRLEDLNKSIVALTNRVAALEAQHAADEQRAKAAQAAAAARPRAEQQHVATISHAKGRVAAPVAASAASAAASAVAVASVKPVEAEMVGVHLRGVYPPTGDDRRAWVLDGKTLVVVLVGDKVHGAKVKAIESDRVVTDAGVIR
jgi:hypothetical protein